VEVAALMHGYDIDMRQDHIFPYVIEKYVKYELQPQFAAMPKEMFCALRLAHAPSGEASGLSCDFRHSFA
jgi:hypothetical protein